jgi:hypothetical protein
MSHHLRKTTNETRFPNSSVPDQDHFEQEFVVIHGNLMKLTLESYEKVLDLKREETASTLDCLRRPKKSGSEQTQSEFLLWNVKAFSSQYKLINRYRKCL